MCGIDEPTAFRYLTPVAHWELGSTCTRALHTALCALNPARSGARSVYPPDCQSSRLPCNGVQHATSGPKGENLTVLA